MKIETSTQWVTPKMCTAWLEANEDNRPLKSPHIENLARAMTRGDWKVNGESLKFDTKGQVLDGQHRMWACIESNVRFQTLITTGLPRATFDTIDTGVIRKANDILAINGEHNTSLLSSCLKLVGRYYAQSMLHSSNYSNKEVEELLEQHGHIREYITFASQKQYRVKWCPPSVIATVWYLASRKNKAQADEFIESLIKGVNLKENSVILTLRNKLIDIKSSTVQHITVPQKIELICMTWNLHRADKTVKHFQLSRLVKTSKDFPKFK